ncbi:uncharacterized protein LOC124288809 isoform X4 [Haliotis rubra]|uniref:uncharacterized protein LOC124288809 isoform X4 n=1 Tax=Haliotis rubra TaxID=36100 RepID=UPI001EE519C6|nr:uncharacterized protein LOC124288809 isoform X4 [Haliotis rubra]
MQHVIDEDENELRGKNDCIEKDGSIVHNVGLASRPQPVSCPKLHLDAARANTNECHVTTDGELVNSRPDTRDVGQNRLQKYWGTYSCPITLPSSLTTIPKYWETETRVRVVTGVWPYVLEMGVVEAGQVDSGWCVTQQRRSWCVSVRNCGRHGVNPCTTVYRERERGERQQDTLSDTPGTQATLHYGIVLDVGKGRLAFIDLDKEIVLFRYDEEFGEPLFPVFSAGDSSSGCSTSMSLISGEDIDMTDTKKALMYQALK